MRDRRARNLLNSSIRKIGEEVSDVMQASAPATKSRLRDGLLLGLGGLGGVQALDNLPELIEEQHGEGDEENSPNSSSRRSPQSLSGARGGGTLSLFASTLEACKELKREALQFRVPWFDPRTAQEGQSLC